MALNNDLDNIQTHDQINKLILSGCVPEVATDENHLTDRDRALLAHLIISKSILNKLNALLNKRLNINVSLQFESCDLLYSCLYLCGEHNQSNLLWSDDECYSLANLCIEKLCKLMHYSGIEELFTCVDVSKIFVGLQCKLKNDNWKKYPAAVECFMWLLKNLKIPRLNSQMYLVMPLPLNMFDDHNNDNMITALDAFQHIIDNTPAAELAMSGHDAVLLKSLENGLRSSEYQLLPEVLKCILSLISKIQLKHFSRKNLIQWNEFDNVLNILLPRMELEHKSEAIECYASVFPFVLESVGISCIRWSERLIPLFSEYIMYNHSTLVTVKAIEMFIQQTWPRKCTHWNVLLTILIKALYNEDKVGQQSNKDNIMALLECIRTLQAVRPECTKSVLKKLKENEELQSKNKFIEYLEMI